MASNLFEATGLANEIVRRERMWRPRHRRMDYWYQAYLLYDAWQDNKPLGERRFVSNEPMTIVDTVHRILTRFPISWWVAVDQYEKTDQDTEKLYGDIERSLYGFMEDINEDLMDRGEMTFDKGAAYHALVRGMIASKVHLTEKGSRPSNIVAVNYDPRFVLPSYDGRGLSSVVAMTPLTLGELQDEYPDIQVDGSPDLVATKIEVWDRVKTGLAFSIGQNRQSITGWCIPPVEHGFFGADGENQEGKVNKLPFIIQDVNGLPFREKPSSIFTTSNGLGPTTPQELRKMTGSYGFEWRTSKIPIAERGRSILASIEKHMPQFNEAVASIWQHFSLDTFGVYFLANRGAMVTEEQQKALGSGALIGIERGDSVQRFAPTPVSQAALQFLAIIQQEREKGTIASVLQAVGEFRSGFQQARMEQSAMNAIEPFHFGHRTWATRVGQLIVDQMAAGSFTKPISLSYKRDVGAGTRTFFRMEFDPKSLKGLKDAGGKPMRILVAAEIEPALPVDMLERANIANVLTNNRRPLISRSTAQEKILKLPDPQRENERIWEDTAQTDPVVVMEEIAMALDRVGKSDVAKMFRDRQGQAMLMQALQRMQLGGQMGMMQGAMGGGQGGGQVGGQGGPGRGNYNDEGTMEPGMTPGPESQPPEFRGEGAAQTEQSGGI